IETHYSETHAEHVQHRTTMEITVRHDDDADTEYICTAPREQFERDVNTMLDCMMDSDECDNKEGSQITDDHVKELFKFIAFSINLEQLGYGYCNADMIKLVPHPWIVPMHMSMDGIWN